MKTRTRKFIAVVSALIIAMSVLPITVFASESEIFISTYAQLIEFMTEVNNGNTYEGSTVTLEVNVDLGGKDSPWTPIGTSSSPFKGTFDGKNHTVSGLYTSSGSYVGFFGYVNDGNIKNLCVDGEVNGSGSTAGIVGYLNSGTVENCGNLTDVKGTSGVGGVVGAFNGACSIKNSFNKGNISGTTGYIGGILGQGANSSSIENCYNTGTVSGPATVGGIGGSHKAYKVNYSNCYNAGTVTDTAGNSNNIGSVVGKTKGTVTNCYYISGTFSTDNGYGTKVDTLTSSDLSSEFTDTESLPVLSWESSVCTDTPVKAEFDEKTELSAELSRYIVSAVNSAVKNSGVSGTFLGNENYTSGASSTATDWMALAMGRFGYYKAGKYIQMIDDGTGYSDYLDAMKAYIEKTYSENNGTLHSVKATEWHRAVVAIGALSGDPTNFGTYNGKNIDLVANGSYNCNLRSGPGTQGINGWIWGLIALDTGMYDVPSGAKYTREDFIKEILKLQLTDGVNANEYGGWVLGGYGSSSDVDITAMAIQALAPYYNDNTQYTYTNSNSKKEVTRTVHDCIDDALDRLSSMMNKNGGFSSWNTDNVESIAQVIVALCSIGIDPAKDERFITSDGTNLLDGMLRFRLSDGGFCHIIGGGWNSMANDQATYALVSYWRYENGMRTLYDMRGEIKNEDAKSILTAKEAIDALPSPTSENYKSALKSALGLFKAVPESERRYVTNYYILASGVENVGGESELDTDTPYITHISVTSVPNKTAYFEGEKFDKTGMIVTAFYNNGKGEKINDYALSVIGDLKLDTTEVYVIYKNFKDKVHITVDEKMPWSGDGTKSSPYLIKTADDLEALSQKVNKGKNFSSEHFAMADNIDLSDISNWTPIGKTSSYQFEGTFDGMGYAIDNLFSTSGGLFGYVGNNCTIKNVTVASGEINAKSSSFIGAIARWSNGADIINCKNGADICCSGYSGGIVGTVRDGGDSTVSGCVNTGDITSSSSSVGGIIGHLDTTRSGYVTVNVTVINCYNLGNITASDNAGGIVGRAQDGHKIINCYNAGVITSLSSGAIIGSATSDNEIKNCYYNSELTESGISSGTGEITGKTESEMKSDDFVSSLGDNYKSDKYGILNGGYPLAKWENTSDANDVDLVIEKINAIGTVTLESENVIKDAESAYNALDDELKVFVSNYKTLCDALNALSSLKSDNENNTDDTNGDNSGTTGDNNDSNGNTADNTADSKSESTVDNDKNSDVPTDNKDEKSDSEIMTDTSQTPNAQNKNDKDNNDDKGDKVDDSNKPIDERTDNSTENNKKPSDENKAPVDSEIPQLGDGFDFDFYFLTLICAVFTVIVSSAKRKKKEI